MMDVGLFTSVPVAPPWDQGDKNLAYSLACAMPQVQFRLLTRQGSCPPQGANLVTKSVYRTARPTFEEKLRVYAWLLANGFQAGGWKVPGDAVMEDNDARLHRLAERQPPDLYHLIYRPYRLSSWMMRLQPEFRRRPTLLTLPASADGRPLSRDLFFADRVVALSQHGQQVLEDLGLRNVVRIPVGIQVDTWAALAGETQRLKAELFVQDHPVVLFPGHYGPGQGSEVMLAALPELVRQVPGVRVLFACRLRSEQDKAREQRFRWQVEQWGLSENAVFFNTVADMCRLIGAADLVALPLQTMRDKVDLPTTLLEALAAGKPILISDIPPMNELIHTAARSGGPIGQAVPAGDAGAFVDAAAAMLNDARSRQAMGAAGQALVTSTYNIQIVARQYEQLYGEMIRA